MWELDTTPKIDWKTLVKDACMKGRTRETAEILDLIEQWEFNAERDDKCLTQKP